MAEESPRDRHADRDHAHADGHDLPTSPALGPTPRQREVLEWTSAGKTVAEVATILGLTPATVEKHLRLARDALDAGSTAQAILKAHVTNQIFLQKTA